jgi:pimeloyl-ACP methyl ester carboxylesterase
MMGSEESQGVISRGLGEISGMASFVLVHGAWHGSWCWQRVRSALQAQGHQVFTPTLTGVGERSHLLSAQVDLRTQTLDVINLVRWEGLTDIVLCGHSYGGFVVSGVADEFPERVRSLVFLDAFVPEHGESLAHYAPITAAQLNDGWKVKPISAEAFGVNPADREWVDSQCTLQSLACFEQPIQLTGRLAQIKRIDYIFASAWGGGHSPFIQFYEKAKARGWRTHEVACGHDVMIDEPAALTELLVKTIHP